MRALRSDSVILLLPSFSIYQYCFVGKASPSLNHLESYLMPFKSSSAWYVALSKASMEILLHLKKTKCAARLFYKLLVSRNLFTPSSYDTSFSWGDCKLTKEEYLV